MLIIATRNLAKGKMRYGETYEVDDDEGEWLINAGLARSGETLKDRGPELDAELVIHREIPPTEVDLNRGDAVDFDDVTGSTDVAL